MPTTIWQGMMMIPGRACLRQTDLLRASHARLQVWGRIDTIEQLYVSHTQDAIDSLGSVDTVAAATTAGDLEDGTYSAVFDTDSSMFHVNEACAGRGTLTVKMAR